MKKLLAFMLVLLALFLVACGEEAESAPKPEETGDILSKGDGFLVTQILDDDYSIKFQYTVTAKDGSVIESAFCQNQPKVAKLKDGELIGIRFITDNKVFCRYYDLVNGLVSPSYFAAFWDNGKLVAYNDYEANGKLVVCDMFDPEGYRAEQEISSNALQLLILGAEANEDETELTVKYKMGESGYEQSLTLPLVNTEG